MTSSDIFGSLFDAPHSNAIFADDSFIAYCLKVEAALATVQAKLGVIPPAAGQKIAQAANKFQVDKDSLRASTTKSSIPIIELVAQLRQQVGSDAASYVHWGATSQDIMDTVLVLQTRELLAHLKTLLQQIIDNLKQLAGQHRHTLMVGRTHSQHALPITFGLKVSNWLAPLLRHQERLVELEPRLLVVQLGGAVGTLAALGEMGFPVQQALAVELNLAVPVTPWHTGRDSVAELAGWLSLVSASLAKMAQDIILMTQSEVAEVRETGDPTRGGSSTMPQKSNPIISEIIIAAARTNASLLSVMHQACIQEHERATHGWQMEWLTLPQMFANTELALGKAAILSEQLVVNVARMEENVAATNGLMMAEAVNLALAPVIGRAEAKQLIKAAVPIALSQNRHLVDVIRDQVEADIDWESLKNERHYLGMSQTLIDRVLEK
ncbi:MAG: 3-carboxy-cis,cis-muconate cycloisomerase [Chloroflexi bacterium]|nr:3-carboxy-cis,cis-muconate cycloisomerase [Chloroflexota bacterium]